VVIVLFEFLTGGIPSKEKFSEASEVVMERGGREYNQSEAAPFKLEGKIWHKMKLFWLESPFFSDTVRDAGSGRSDRSSTGIMNFLGNSNPNMPLENGKLDASVMVTLESVGVRQSRFFDLLLHKLVEILNIDELFGLSPRVVVLIPRTGM